MSQKIIKLLFLMFMACILQAKTPYDSLHGLDTKDYLLYGEDYKQFIYYYNKVQLINDLNKSQYFDKFYFAAKKLEQKNTKFLATYHYLYGRYRTSQGYYFLGLQNLLAAFRYLNNNSTIGGDEKETKAYILIDIGNLFYKLNLSEDILGYYEKAKQLFINSGSKFGYSLCLNNIALVYEKGKKYDLAYKYFNEAYEIRKDLPDGQFLSAHSMVYLARIKYKLDDFKTAVSLLGEALQILGNDSRDFAKSRMIDAYFVLGDIYKEQGDRKLVFEQYKKAEKICLENGFESLLIDIYLKEISLYIDSKEVEKARPKVMFVLNSRAIDINSRMEALLCLSKINMLSGNNLEALKYMNEYNAVKDTVHNLLLSKSFQELQLGIKSSEAIFRNENDKIRLLQRSYITIIITISVIIVLGMLLLIVYIKYKSRYNDQERLKQFNEASLEGIIIHDNSSIIDVNDNFLKVVGYHRDEVINNSIWDVIDPDFHDLVLEKISNEETSYYTIAVFDKNQRKHIVEVMSRPIIFNNRKVRSASLRDITDKLDMEKKLIDEEIKFKTIIDLLPLGVLMMKVETAEVAFCNKTAAKLLGIEQWRLKDTRLVFDSKSKIDIFNIGKELDEQNWIKEFEYKIPSENETELWVLVTVALIKINDIDNFLIGINNISKRKLAEEELIRAREIAEGANKTKTEFLANISHEIRTPMNAILGFSEILLKTITNPVEKQYCESIKSSGKTLLMLINDILDLSKIEAGKLKIELGLFNFYYSAKEIISIFESQAKEKGLKIELKVSENVPSSLLLDEVRVRQILLNLIGNAVKFTESGIITVTVNSEDIGNNKVDITFSVSDTGIGIPQENQELIFEAFRQRSGSSSRKYSGTGLGLTISKRLTEMMGGTLVLRSEEGKGSEFTVKLFNIDKDSSVTQENNHKVDDSTVYFRQQKLLVVDDFRENREIVKLFLRTNNIQILQAADSNEAIAIIKSTRPDIILMDLKLPIVSGVELARIIKNEYYSDIPTIAYSASAKDEISSEELKEFTGFLQKPFSKNELVLELMKYIQYDNLDITKQDERKNYTHDEIKDKIDSKLYRKNLNILKTRFIDKIEEILTYMELESIKGFSIEFKNFIVLENFTIFNNIADDLLVNCNTFQFEKIKKDLYYIVSMYDILENYLKDKVEE